VIHPLAQTKRALSLVKHFRPLFHPLAYRRDLKAMKNLDTLEFIPAMRKAARFQRFVDEIADAYLNCNITADNQNFYPSQVDPETPILVCTLKNGMNFLPVFLDYHRALGVEHFCFVDNGSDDGSVDFLREQPDVNLYTTADSFSPQANMARRLRVIERFGLDRWYLLLDADELFDYIGREGHQISDVVEQLEARELNQAQCFMLDMYSDGGILADATTTPLINAKSGTISKREVAKLLKTYALFDASGYTRDAYFEGRFVKGGPRARVAGMWGVQSKVPLIKPTAGDLPLLHSYYPYRKSWKAPLASVIRHFKFLPGDEQKFRERVEKGNFASGSEEYKLYFDMLDANPDATFFSADASARYENSASLKLLRRKPGQKRQFLSELF
jgi:hypothetical protein